MTKTIALALVVSSFAGLGVGCTLEPIGAVESRDERIAELEQRLSEEQRQSARTLERLGQEFGRVKAYRECGSEPRLPAGWEEERRAVREYVEFRQVIDGYLWRECLAQRGLGPADLR